MFTPPDQLNIAYSSSDSSADSDNVALRSKGCNFTTISNDEFDFLDIDDEEAKEFDDKLALLEELKLWALKHRITHRAVNELLSILNLTCKLKYLPRDSRTLLATPSSVNILNIGEGNYWHNGLKNCLANVFWNIKK